PVDDRAAGGHQAHDGAPLPTTRRQGQREQGRPVQGRPVQGRIGQGRRYAARRKGAGGSGRLGPGSSRQRAAPVAAIGPPLGWPAAGRPQAVTDAAVQVEATGGTVGEARWAALHELERRYPALDRNQVEFVVVSEGQRGLLGVGYEPARVVAALAEEPA